LADVARRCDDAVLEARAELVRAVRQAAANGMSQAQIAAEIGRSQPEVSRLLHFHGTSPLARRVRKHAVELKRLAADAGGSHLRVFGSVATGHDHEGSDIDLLFTMGRPLSLMQLGELEARMSDAIGAKVDLIPECTLRPDLRDRVVGEAVAL
jgi:predicted nucleotidyltransferase